MVVLKMPCSTLHSKGTLAHVCVFLSDCVPACPPPCLPACLPGHLLACACVHHLACLPVRVCPHFVPARPLRCPQVLECGGGRRRRCDESIAAPLCPLLSADCYWSPAGKPVCVCVCVCVCLRVSASLKLLVHCCSLLQLAFSRSSVMRRCWFGPFQFPTHTRAHTRARAHTHMYVCRFGPNRCDCCTSSCRLSQRLTRAKAVAPCLRCTRFVNPQQ